MKNILFALFLFASVTVTAQTTVTVNPDGTATVTTVTDLKTAVKAAAKTAFPARAAGSITLSGVTLTSTYENGIYRLFNGTAEIIETTRVSDIRREVCAVFE